MFNNINLFIFDLFNDAISSVDCSSYDDCLVVNWKGCIRKQLRPNFRPYPSTCLEELR
jgi:hypothetical protein